MIVATRHRDVVRWYDSEPEIWILDQQRWAEAFRGAGHILESENDFSERFGIQVLDSEKALDFFEHIVDFRVSQDELQRRFREALTSANDWFDVAEDLPVLFVDFDTRKLWSIHPELSSFVEFVPPGWTAESRSFFDEMPTQTRYWLIDGKDALRPFID